MPNGVRSLETIDFRVSIYSLASAGANRHVQRTAPFSYLARARASDRMEALRRSKGTRPYKNCLRHIDVSHSRQPLVKGERLMCTERKTATIPSRPVHNLATSCVAIYTATNGKTYHTRGSSAAREGLRLPPAARPMR